MIAALIAEDPAVSVELKNKNDIRATLKEEFEHANLLRSLLGVAAPAADPIQTFYFPKGTFDKLDASTGAATLPILDSLENAFIGAYLTAVRAFVFMVANTSTNRGVYYKLGNSNLSANQLCYFSQVCALIMGVEAEHRALGRVTGGQDPANNRCHQQTAGVDSVFTGTKSAVVALTPFLTPSTGPAFSLKEELDKGAALTLPCELGPPAFYTMYMPPLISIVCPWMPLAASLIRNAITAAISSLFCKRPAGVNDFAVSNICCVEYFSWK